MGTNDLQLHTKSVDESHNVKETRYIRACTVAQSAVQSQGRSQQCLLWESECERREEQAKVALCTYCTWSKC